MILLYCTGWVKSHTQCTKNKLKTYSVLGINFIIQQTYLREHVIGMLCTWRLTTSNKCGMYLLFKLFINLTRVLVILCIVRRRSIAYLCSGLRSMSKRVTTATHSEQLENYVNSGQTNVKVLFIFPSHQYLYLCIGFTSLVCCDLRECFIYFLFER